MKRVNLLIDVKILEEVKRLSGEQTYSATVQRALADFVRHAKSGRILEIRGSRRWEGEPRADSSEQRPV